MPRRIGFAGAVEMSLTGQFIDAAEALRLGIVNRVVPHDDLLATARAVALDIAVKDQRAVRSLLGSFDALPQPTASRPSLAVERETARAWLRSFDHTQVESRRE